MKTYRDKIVSEDSLLEEAYNRCLQEMYFHAQPSIDFEKAQKEANKKFEKTGEKTHIIDQHYLSSDMYEKIIKKYVDAYHLESEFFNDCDIIKRYMDGEGMINGYGKDELGNRKIEKLPKLEEVIGKENAEKVFEYIENAKNFYRFDNGAKSLRWGLFNLGPTSNKEMVEKYWEEQGKPIKIRDYTEEEQYDLVYYGEIESEE